MNEFTAFLTMFPGCAVAADLCGGLGKAYVTNCDIDLTERSMTLAAHFEKMPAPAELTSLRDRLKSEYGLHNIELVPDFPKPKPIVLPKSGTASGAATGDVLMPWYLMKKRDDDLIISASPDFVVRPAAEMLGVRLIATPMQIYVDGLLACRGYLKDGATYVTMESM